MTEYTLSFARSASKELRSLERATAQRILRRIEDLTLDPRPPASRKLRGRADLWRLRIGQYRVIYSIDDHALLVDINAIRHRRDAYR